MAQRARGQTTSEADERTDAIHFRTHALARGLINGALRLLGPSRRFITRSEREWIVEIDDRSLSWRTPDTHARVPIEKMDRVAVTPAGGLRIEMRAGDAIALPRLCRPEPVAEVANALIAGTLGATEGARPSCRSCAHLTAALTCRIGSGAAAPGPCCDTDPDSDWCGRHQPAEN